MLSILVLTIINQDLTGKPFNLHQKLEPVEDLRQLIPHGHFTHVFPHALTTHYQGEKSHPRSRVLALSQKLELRLTTQQSVSQPVSRLGSKMILYSLT